MWKPMVRNPAMLAPKPMTGMPMHPLTATPMAGMPSMTAAIPDPKKALRDALLRKMKGV